MYSLVLGIKDIEIYDSYKLYECLISKIFGKMCVYYILVYKIIVLIYNIFHKIWNILVKPMYLINIVTNSMNEYANGLICNIAWIFHIFNSLF